MKNLNQKLEYYKKMRDYFSDKSKEEKDIADYCDFMVLCGESNCFVVLGHDIASGTLHIISSFADYKVYKLQKKQEKQKTKQKKFINNVCIVLNRSRGISLLFI